MHGLAWALPKTRVRRGAHSTSVGYARNDVAVLADIIRKICCEGLREARRPTPSAKRGINLEAELRAHAGHIIVELLC